MAKIKNRLFQPIGIQVDGGRTLHLQARQEAEVSKADLESRHMQVLIKSGLIALASEKTGGGSAAGAVSRKPEVDRLPSS